MALICISQVIIHTEHIFLSLWSYIYFVNFLNHVVHLLDIEFFIFLVYSQPLRRIVYKCFSNLQIFFTLMTMSY